MFIARGIKSKFSILQIYIKNFDFVSSLDETFPKENFERRFSPMDRSLRRELKSTFGNDNYWFNTVNYLDIVEVRIRSGNNHLQFFFPKERVVHLLCAFLFYGLLCSLILILIAILFLKTRQDLLLISLKQHKDLVREIILTNLDPQVLEKSGMLLMNLMEWQKN